MQNYLLIMQNILQRRTTPENTEIIENYKVIYIITI